ncbi:hypothetical protein [Pelagovum pacificum]|uniref:Uncharacterized protein n=1 Tax=Pelagovum pacificum TaxID=2588711 RepID=A0A5C5GDW9_9RHOB|nr:hypothetical protein [Pelagovum pacificum]QQA43894.1 hypothetical protein I8N54_04760 [Pelagovum pacificum]QQA43898.1 hypothetical protein I8N54_04780 [Pelagovum pacificum]TNY32971.1 hypothetical protein FHY64_06760 [Pelagovum pacificum]TNY32975.1 hypothetical protein FHY64_06780 [Pelagovum pacificum]
MFKTALTASAFSLIAGLASAAQPTIDVAQPVAQTTVDATSDIELVNYYCEWVTVYDAWGNWFTVYECY